MGQIPELDLLNMPEDKAYDTLNKWFHKCMRARSHKERSTLLNLSFYLGMQNVRIATLANGRQQFSVETNKRPRTRQVENHIRPMVKAEVARINRNKPIGWVEPEGVDLEDVEAADAGQAVVNHVWRNYQLQRHTQHATWWMCLGGTGLLGLNYDASSADPQGAQGAFVPRALGSLEFSVPDMLNPELDEQPYFFINKAYDIDDVYDRWGVRITGSGDSFTVIDNRLIILLQQQNPLGMARMFGASAGSASQDKSKQVLIKECWIKPNPKTAPNGAVIIFGGNRILAKAEWPEWLRQGKGFIYPFAPLRYNWEAGFWGGAFVDDLIEPQRRRNAAIERVVTYLRLMSRISTAMPKGVEPKSFFGGEATVWEVPPGTSAPSHPVVPPVLGDTVKMELDNTAAAMMDLGYQHEVTKGTTPPNVRAGIAIEALKESDDSPLSISIETVEEAHQRLGNIIIATVKGNWDERRLVNVLGQDGQIEAQSFIAGDDVGGQYVVQGGSAWPFFRYERRAEVMDYHDRGLIPPDISLKLMDLGALPQITNALYIDEREVRRENQMYKQYRHVQQVNPMTGMVDIDPMTGAPATGPSGPLPPVQFFQNHKVHLEGHYNEMKRASFANWPEEAKEALLEHVQAHLEAIAQITIDTQGPSEDERQREDEQQGFDQEMREREVAVKEQQAEQKENDGKQGTSGVQGSSGSDRP